MSFKTLHPRISDSVLVVPNVAALSALSDPQEGDLRYVADVNQLYAYNGSSWAAVAGGVTTPGSSTDNAVVRWDGTDASAIQNSPVTINDSGAVAGASIDADTNTITNIENDNIKAGAAIAADKIADGSVSSTEFQYLSGVTSDIQAQLNTNATAISDHLSDTVDAHDASAISNSPSGNLTSTDVQAALNELQGDIDTNTTAISDHISDTVDAHDASAISNVPSGNLAATDVQAALNELQSDVDTREVAANKGVAGGYASLDGGGKVPITQLPASIMEYKGVWDASTNTPTLADGTGDVGDVYNVSVAGTQDLGSGSITFSLGDWVIYNGTVWQKSDNSDDVTSVNGFTGTVVLDYDDVNAVSEMGAVTDNRLVRTNGTTGDLVQESAVTLSDAGAMSGITQLDVDNIRIDGNTVEATSGNATITAAGDVVLDAATDSVVVQNANSFQVRGTGGVPAGVTIYDGDASNFIKIDIPSAVATNRTPQIPDDTGNFVLTSATQAITNKDIDGGTASDTSRLTVPQNTKANLDALTRKEGTVVYANDEDTLYVDDGTNLVAVGSGAGSGSGEKNYVTNPSAASDITGWTNVGDLDVARTTTAAELPREYTTGTGIKITADANTQSTADYVYYDFTLDDVDLNKKLKIQWAQKQTGSYVAGNLAVIITTQADRTTAVATPDVTAIPAFDGVFQATFDSASTATLSLVIRATTDMATDAGIVISDVIVGPGQIQAVPAGAYLGSLSGFTVTANGSKGFTISNQCWRKDNLLTCKFALDGDAVASGSGATTIFTLNLPSGYTIDSTALPSSTVSSSLNNVGKYTELGIASSGNFSDEKMIFPLSSTTLRFLTGNGTSTVIRTTDLNAARDMDIMGEFTIPIAEWAGAPNYAGSNDYEVAYNSSTSISDDTTSFAYGPAGGLVPSGTASAGGFLKRVRFQTAIQPTDEIFVIIKTSDGKAGLAIAGAKNPSAGLAYGPINAVSDIGFGTWESVTGSTTDIDVRFYRYRNGTSIWSNSDGMRWYVVKAKAGAAVGFGLADTSGRAGLVNPYNEGSGVVYSGTYTPTLTNLTNVDASTAFELQYMRVGRAVTISGIVNIDPSASGGIDLRMSLPSGLDMSTVATVPAGGTATASGIDNLTIDKATTTTVRFIGNPTTRTNSTYRFVFMYRMD